MDSDTDEQRLGDEAEALFDKWLRSVGIQSAKFDPDRLGVDRYFEIRAVQAADVTIDQRTRAAQCHAQIKGTRHESGRAQIALSVWERLAKSDLPCFVVGVQFDLSFNPIRTHLIHVGPPEISAIYKRLRQMKSSQADALHKRAWHPRWTSQTEVRGENTAAALRDRMLKHIGDVESYGSRKRGWRVKADPNGSQIVRVRPNATPEAIVAALLGDVDRIPVQIVGITETLFGIQQDRTPDVSGRVEVQFELPSMDGELVVQSNGRRTSIHGRWRTTRDVDLGLPPEAHVDRFLTPTLQVSFRASEVEFRSLALSAPDRPVSLRDLRRAAEVVLRTNQRPFELELRQRGGSDPEPARILA